MACWFRAAAAAATAVAGALARAAAAAALLVTRALVPGVLLPTAIFAHPTRSFYCAGVCDS